MKKVILFIFCILLSIKGFSQTYPVQVNSWFQGTKLTRLSDFATSIEEKYKLQILSTDTKMFNNRVKLKLSIEGFSFKTQSVSYDFIAPEIYLTGGVPVVLSNIELRSYFEYNNLQGLSEAQYARPLPDGNYNFCWEVFDYNTGHRISQKTCTPVYIILNDPPLLNIPARNESIVAKDFTNIIFTWTPRNFNGTNTTYEFHLRELWDENIDPQAAFLASPDLWTEETNSTTLLYDMSKPGLIEGKKYGWMVKAKSVGFDGNSSAFKNEGNSEIFWFKYATDCKPATYVLAEAQSPTKEKITWQSDSKQNKFHIQYRRKKVPLPIPETETKKEKRKREKADAEVYEWFEEFTRNEQITLTGLEEGATYEYRLGATCDPLTNLEQSYVYSNIQEFTMPTKAITTETAYNCGVAPQLSITNKTPLANLDINEKFTASDFEVVVLERSGSNGVFSGKGYITVPYLADTKLEVEFNDIKINSAYQMYDGFVFTAYDATWRNVVDVQPTIDAVSDLIGDLIHSIRDAIKEQIDNGTITKEEAEELTKEVDAQEILQQKATEEIKQVEKEIADAKKENKDAEASEEQKKTIETNKIAQQGAVDKLQEIASDLKVKAGKGNRIEDTYFNGLLPLAGAGVETFKIKKIDGGELTFKNTDAVLETYSTTISGKKYTFVFTSSNSTEEQIKKAKNLVDNPDSGIVIYNHYDLKKGKLGYKVNFANDFFDGIKQQDIEEIKALYTEALNNKLDEAQNVTDWGSEIFKATTEINTFFQDLISKIVLPESIWNPADKDFASNKYKMQALDAGLIDGALDEVKSIPLLISIVVDYTTSSKTREKINQSFNDFSFKAAMKSWYEERKALYTGQSIQKIEHQTGKDVVAVGTLVATGGLAGVTKVKKGLSFVEELVDVVKKKGVKEGIELVGKFTLKQIDDYVEFATKNKNAKKVMLGSWDDGLPTSYIQRAGRDHTYFDMGTKWDDVRKIVDNGIDESWKKEMWKINKKFIDEQKTLDKKFFFSHEPWKADHKTFLSKEAEYLIDIGAKDFKKINNNTWEVIW